MSHFQKRTGGGMRRSRRKSSGMAGFTMWQSCLIATLTRSAAAVKMSNNCRAMRQSDASEKKGGRKHASSALPALREAIEGRVAEHTAGSPVDEHLLWTNRSPRQI